jgi:F-type H+-transporting ATPase subunit a
MFPLIPTAHAAGTEEISIKLAPYVIGEFAGVSITATMMTVWLSMFLITAFVVLFRSKIALVPGGVQNVLEAIIGGAYDYVEDTLESPHLARRYFPILMTIFLFLLVMNWVGLLPGVTSIGFFEGHGADKHFIPLLYPPATDLNIAIGFAFVSMVVIEFAGIAALGVFKYGSKFFTFAGASIGERVLNFFVGILELISELGRLVSFSFRLFGNIFAGKTLLTVGMFFVPFLLPVPILAYEVFVGFIQAAVFAFLTLIFIKLAVAEPHH